MSDQNMLASVDRDVRIVAIMNKSVEAGPAMNAVLHLGSGLVNLLPSAERDRLAFLSFQDADGQLYPSISARSFIVLRGSNGEIARARDEAMAREFPSVAFLQTMTGDTYLEQLAHTRATPKVELIYFGLAIFGRKDALVPITKRFSLWR